MAQEAPKRPSRAANGVAQGRLAAWKRPKAAQTPFQTSILDLFLMILDPILHYFGNLFASRAS